MLPICHRKVEKYAGVFFFPSWGGVEILRDKLLAVFRAFHVPSPAFSLVAVTAESTKAGILTKATVGSQHKAEDRHISALVLCHPGVVR